MTSQLEDRNWRDKKERSLGKEKREKMEDHHSEGKSNLYFCIDVRFS
jgi:hypothetical protein